MNAFVGRAACALLSLFAIAAAARGESEQALWRTQEINFTYHGYTTIYDCRTLSTKVSQLLFAAGARQGTSIRAESCAVMQPFGGAPTQMASMRINVTSPTLATAEAESDLARDSGRRALLNRLGVQSVPSAAFPAFWGSLDLARIDRANFRASDCELLQQIADQVLPKMAITVENMNSCSMSPHRLSKPTLKVLALLPAPETDATESS
jgi:hypothetical protein